MQAEVTKKLFTVDEYYRTADVGIRDPSGNSHNAQQTLRPGDLSSPIAFPDVVFDVKELLG